MKLVKSVLLFCAFIVSLSAQSAVILVEDGTLDVSARLVSLGHRVVVSNSSSWGANFDYSPYDLVAFNFGSSNPADMDRFLSAVTNNQLGALFFRGSGSEATLKALGLIANVQGSMYWQNTYNFSITNNSHAITSTFQKGSMDLGFSYITHSLKTGTNTTTLATGSTGAALVVHNTLKAAILPFYGHTANFDKETAASLLLTQNAINWAARPTNAVPEPESLAIIALGLLGLAVRRYKRV